MSIFDIGSLSSSQNYSGLIDGANPFDLYNFSVKESGSFSLSLNGLSDNADVELLNSSGKVLYSSAGLGISAEAIAVSNLAAGNYAVRVLQVGGSTNYNLNLAANAQVDPLTGMDLISGYFSVGESGQVGVDPLFDGGWYKGELAVFSLEGMEKYVPGSEEFIQEAVVRSLSNSQQGYVVFSDVSEDAKFSGGLGEGNYNDGKYFGEKTFAMKPGDKFGFMLIPNSTLQDVLNNPAIGADKRPLFSLVTANPNQGFHIGQIADINGEGNTFSIEDQRFDSGADKDYNDLIFKVSGATGKAIKLDEVINPAKDWRTSEQGKQFLDHIKPEPAVEAIPIIEDQPVVENKPIVETPPVVE
ncbi:MAG TPA: DNA/RNA endonuclease G, partial [Cyanobacteria bacterium UBA11371]|nr:DNA/RNA endonuclease G [Cyanobacteria bacterium UBA11371]